MNHKFPSIINVGLSSILTIFLVLTMSVFASLSLMTAESDYRLSQSCADRLTEVASANSKGEQFLKKIDVLCVKSYDKDKNPTPEKYQSYILKMAEKEEIACTKKDGRLLLETSIALSESQVLHIIVEPVFPTQTGDSYLKVTEWQIQKTTNWKIDDSLPVYQNSDNPKERKQNDNQ